ncbi:unnamed protein product [Ectocarpus sp. CCAP 1310/34]|nr:unnamed protein product [Ectocarpus sp. CCAP 1310/34]
MLMVAVAEFDKDPTVTANMIKIGTQVEYTGNKDRSTGKKTTVVTDAEALWAMLYADDATIVSRSPESLEKMMSVIVRVADLLELMVSEPKTEIMCMLPKGIEERPFTVSAAGQTYKQTDRFVYRGRCEETIEATVRKRRLCFAGFVMRMEDSRLPKRMLLGAMAGGVGYRGGQESDWVSRLGEDLVAFNMGDEKEGAQWKESAKDPEVEDGVAWFMRIWHRQEAEASAKRQRAREAEAESTVISRPKSKRAGEAAVGGKKGRPSTAVEASRAAESANVANYVPG